jgi:hypothetical protein
MLKIFNKNIATFSEEIFVGLDFDKQNGRRKNP